MSEAFNLAASLTAIILAIVAIAQATYYFVKTKASEERVAVALADIKSATEALEKLSGRYLDRLTKHVTEHSARQSDDIYQLAMLVAEIPRTRTEDLPKPTENSLEPAQVQEFVSLYILLHHYCALTNICAQVALPLTSEIDGKNPVHSQLCGFVDMSQGDFQFFDNLLVGIDPGILRQNAHCAVYEHTVAQRRAAVRNMGQIFVAAQTPGAS
jgi:hypothetical protein